MENLPQEKPVSTPGRRRTGVVLAVIVLIVLVASFRLWRDQGEVKKIKTAGAVQVVSTLVARSDVPVRLTANGSVSAIQTVEVHPQISAAVKTVHIKEGSFVRKGDRLFTLDTRTEEANLSKAEAQVAKDRTDLASAERNLKRQRELFGQEYISQAELDAAQNQVDSLRGQLAVNQAIVTASRVAHSYGEITAPIAGRTGAIAAYPGSLVQPNSAALVSITQIDPINVSFTLPERELAPIQQAMAKGKVPVSVRQDSPGQPALTGVLTFVDSTVDSASGTIRLKAELPNPDHHLWPGMFVTVTLSPRTLPHALTVPVQAIQTGPDRKFIYAIGEDHKAVALPVNVVLIQDNLAVIEGVAPGTRIVVEGGQNIRPDSIVEEHPGNGSQTENRHGAGPNNEAPVQPGTTGRQ